MDANTWIAFAALLLSGAVAVRGELVRRSGAGQAKKAEHAAEQSAEAAQRSAAALERMADQWGEYMSRQEKRDQRQWSGRPSLPTAASGWETRGAPGPWAGPVPGGPAEPVVHWTVDKISGRKHQLRNLGRVTAYDVELRSENAIRFDGPEKRNVKMGESLEFLAVGSLQTGTPELIVSWADEPDGDCREWRRPLP